MDIKSLIVVIVGIIILSGSIFFLKAAKHMKIESSMSDESDRKPANNEIEVNLMMPML